MFNSNNKISKINNYIKTKIKANYLVKVVIFLLKKKRMIFNNILMLIRNKIIPHCHKFLIIKMLNIINSQYLKLINNKIQLKINKITFSNNK
jgi:hypothetical protein